MKRNAKSAREIKDLRAFLHKTQAEFGADVGATQAMVSAWESGDSIPPVRVLLKLANMAPYPACFEFWGLAGVDVKILVRAAGRRLVEDRSAPEIKGEVVSLPRLRFTEEGHEEAGPPLLFPAECVPNPATTICVSVDREAAGIVDAPRGLVILDTSCEGADDLSSLWGQVVMLRKSATESPSFGAPGVYAGRLHIQWHDLRAEAGVVSAYLASLTETRWAMTDIARRIYPEALKGLAVDDTVGREKRLVEVLQQARSELRLGEEIRILGQVIGRLTGHINRGRS